MTDYSNKNSKSKFLSGEGLRVYNELIKKQLETVENDIDTLSNQIESFIPINDDEIKNLFEK